MDLDPPTPPMRRPKRTPKNSKMPRPKKNAFSAAAFAKGALFNQDEIDTLKPLPRPKQAMEPDHEQDILVQGDDFNDEISLPDEDVVAPPRSPNYNPGLSNSDMSRSPSPFNPVYPDYSYPENTRYSTHPVNVPSAMPELYFARDIPRLNEPHVNALDNNGNRVSTKLPVSYWKWPTAKEEHVAKENQRAKIYKDYEPVPYKPVVQTLLDSQIKITIQTVARPPHINWILRKREAVEEAKRKAAEAIERTEKIDQEKARRRKAKLLNMEAANAAVMASIKLDEDGFIHVKGTRKRKGPGIDMEEDRPRRSYNWKNGPPKRGKEAAAEKEAKAKAKLEADALAKIRAIRRARGEHVTTTEESSSSSEDETPVIKKAAKKVVKQAVKKTPKPGKKTAAAPKKRQVRKRVIIDSNDSNSDAEPITTIKKAAGPKKTPAPKRAPPRKASAPKKSAERVIDSDDENEEDFEDSPTPPAKKAPVKRKALAPKKSAATMVHSGDEDEQELDDPPTPPAKKAPVKRKAKTKKTLPASTVAVQGVTVGGKIGALKKSAQKVVNSDNEDEEGYENLPTPPAKKAPVKKKAPAKRSAPAMNAPETIIVDDGTPIASMVDAHGEPARKKVILPTKKAVDPYASFGYGGGYGGELLDLA